MGKKAAKTPAVTGEFRIIGGTYRSRRLVFPALAGLRPSPDRVRETLFNWLAPVIEGARCLDLFAGSGALGLEALSRGAATCVFVEQAGAAVTALRGHLSTLDATSGEAVQAEVLAWLAGSPRAFDIVFLDPPYAAGLLEPACAALVTNGWLASGARVYLENAATEGAPTLPAGWTLLRSKKAGQVGYHLALSNR